MILRLSRIFNWYVGLPRCYIHLTDGVQNLQQKIDDFAEGLENAIASDILDFMSKLCESNPGKKLTEI